MVKKTMGKSFWIIIICIFILLSLRLAVTPVHLNQDELQFALNGYSIAKTGMSEYGQFMPLYFKHLDSFWATPVTVYAAAFVFKFLPFSETSARLATVIVSTLSVLVIGKLSFKLFADRKFGLAAMLIMATVPAFFINSRLLLDNVYPVLFVALWMYLLLVYSKSRNIWSIFLSGLFLGIGIHSYHAAKITMPLYFLATLVYIFFAKFPKKSYLYFSLGFALPFLIFIPWLIKYPDTLLNQVSYASAIDRSIDASKGYLAVFSPERITSYVSSYLTYFSPRILFIEGDRSLIHSTGKVGLFLFPLLFLIIFGIAEVLKKKNLFGKLILFGFLTYPVAAALINDPQRISRGLVVVPFAVLLAMYGVRFMLVSKEGTLKLLLSVLVIWTIGQFSFFINDYFGDYRIRSEAYFNYDVGGAMESVINSTRIRSVSQVYFDVGVPFSLKYYKFYALKHHTNFDSVSVFDHRMTPFTEFPDGSLVVIKPEMVIDRNDILGDFEKVETIREPDGRESFWIYYRDVVQ